MKTGGGTSAEEGSPWWIAGVVAVALLVLVVVMSSRGSSGATNAPAPVLSGQSEEIVDPEALPAPLDDSEIDVDTTDSEDAKLAAMSVLETDLQAGELWTTLEIDNVDDRFLVLRTDFCRESGLRDSVAKATAQLKKVGFTRLGCYESHGEPVFENPL
jgi:hypothetical protein